jgi:uncharacterized protein
MNSRCRTTRKVLQPPAIMRFNPVGKRGSIKDTNPVIIFLEEYEAIRLCDYEMLNHQQASYKMCVSRPTFTRIYASALRKIAQAIVEGKPVTIEGGKVCFDSDWYHCSDCESYFNHPDKQIPLKACPLCSSNAFRLCRHGEIDQHETN